MSNIPSKQRLLALVADLDEAANVMVVRTWSVRGITNTLRHIANSLPDETAGDDVRDAARYRYLRGHLGSGFAVKQAHGDPLGFAGPTLLDSALDAALAPCPGCEGWPKDGNNPCTVCGLDTRPIPAVEPSPALCPNGHPAKPIDLDVHKCDTCGWIGYVNGTRDV